MTLGTPNATGKMRRQSTTEFGDTEKLTEQLHADAGRSRSATLTAAL